MVSDLKLYIWYVSINLTSGSRGVLCAETRRMGCGRTRGPCSGVRVLLLGSSDWVSFFITIDDDSSSSFLRMFEPNIEIIIIQLENNDDE